MQPNLPNPLLETSAAPSCACEPPLERLRRAGAEALADAELLGVLLGGARESDLAAAERLLSAAGGLAGLAANDLLPHPPQLAALRELATRLARAHVVPAPVLDRPDNVIQYLLLRYARTAQEVLGVFYLDPQNRLLAEREIFRGTRYRTAIELPAILREGLRLTAAGVLLWHTHPAGSATPSPEDLEFTRRVHDACELLGLRLVDHFILASPQSWCSLVQRGAW